MFKWPLIERPTASKGHEKLIFVGYFSIKIEVLRDFKFTKNKDLTQKRAVWAGAWDRTLTIIPQSYRGTFDKRTHRMYRIFSHTCDKFSMVFPDNYPFHRVIRHKAVAGGGKTYSRKLFSRLFLDLCTTNDLVCTKLKTEREASSRIIVPL